MRKVYLLEVKEGRDKITMFTTIKDRWDTVIKTYTPEAFLKAYDAGDVGVDELRAVLEEVL